MLRGIGSAAWHRREGAHAGVFAAKEPERPVSGAAFGGHPDIPGPWLQELFGMTEGDVYLSPVAGRRPPVG